MIMETLEMVGIDGAPPVDLLTREVRAEFNNASWIYGRNDEAFNARFCIWPGQTPDGLKHQSATGSVVLPWEGASDARVRTVDMVVNDEVRLIKESFSRARLQGIPTIDSERMAMARKVSTLLEHTRRVDMLPFIRRQVGIYTNWRSMYGGAIMNVWWEQERRLEMLDLTRDRFHMMIQPHMEEMNQQSNPNSRVAGWSSMDTADLLRDKLKEPVALAWLIEIAPLLDLRSARRVLADLRSVGSSMIPQPYVLTNRPRWTALRPFVDVFFPTSTTDLQKARWIAHREMVTETALRDGIRTMGYDRAFVDEACKRKGQMMVEATWNERTLNERRAGYGYGAIADDSRNMIELLHVFFRTMGPDGTPTVMRTILNTGVKDLAAWHGVHRYAHGHYPYIYGAREEVDQALLESRGLGELLCSDQHEIKFQIDSRRDRTAMATMPPVVTPSQRGLIVPQLRPNMRLQLHKPDDVKWLNPPGYDSGSIEIEKSARARVDTYCGRMNDNSGVPAPVAQLSAQSLVNDVLLELTGCAYQTFALGLQYWDPEHMQRVAGLEKPGSPEEIRGMTDFVQLVFDVRDLNDETLKTKWEMWQTFVKSNDTYGLVDGAGFIKRVAESLDPWLAGELLQNPQQASQAEIDDEENQFTKIAAGVEPRMQEAGQNFGLRLQTLQGLVMNNPDTIKRYQTDEIFKKMIDNRVKHFQFMLTQQQNAQTGRVGATPVLGDKGPPQLGPQAQPAPAMLA